LQRPLIQISLFLLFPAALLAQPATIAVEQAECLPLEGNGVITARLENELPATTVRVHFRRLNDETEDFYYVVARPLGNGSYRAVLPQAEDREFETPGERESWGEWWRQRDASEDRGERARRGMFERRDWLHNLDARALQDWLLGLDNEPVEYFATLVDAAGSLLARSEMKVVQVRQDCAVTLTDRERGEAENLTVGETAGWQAGQRIFHWQCSGIVTRIDPEEILKADPFCRGAFPSRWPQDEDVGGRGLPTAAGKQAFKTVQVFYGTDRRRVFTTTTWSREDRSALAYGGDRGRLELGTCDVSIPVEHEKGVLEAPGFMEKADPAKHVLLLSVAPRPRQLFLDELRQSIRLSEEKAALVFIHGYNVTFEDAARRTAQMAYDLEFDGAPVMYSWPSQASVNAYPVDEANIRWTVPNLLEFLRLVALETDAESVHLIAHSMGNRAMTEALRRFATEEPPSGKTLFNQIALVAPDLDTGVFSQEIAPAIQSVGQRITLYASSQDNALLISSGVHGYPRAGDLSDGVVVTSGVETVDATDVDTSLLRAIKLGHSYFAEKPTVISDLRALLAGVDAARREQLIPAGDATSSYWKFVPGQ
jgi:esterase/lipase superfamily enzyme